MAQNNENKEKKSKFQAMLEKGSIAGFYTQNGWFCNVYPCLNIDKIKFSFAQKGQNGKGFDVFMDVMRFDELCLSVIRGEFARKAAASTSEFPDVFEYKTGPNASLEVNVGKGKNSNYCIQGRNKSAGKNALIGIPCCDLNDMAFLWVRWLRNMYYDSRKKVLLKAMEANSKYYTAVDEDYESYISQPEPEPAPSTTKTSKPETKPELKKVTLSVLGKEGVECKERSSSPGDFAMQCTTESKEETLNVVFKKSSIEKMGAEMWQKFLNRCNNGENTISFKAEFSVGTEGNRTVHYFEKFIS